MCAGNKLKYFVNIQCAVMTCTVCSYDMLKLALTAVRFMFVSMCAVQCAQTQHLLCKGGHCSKRNLLSDKSQCRSHANI